jgi:hypothetical protein
VGVCRGGPVVSDRRPSERSLTFRLSNRQTSNLFLTVARTRSLCSSTVLFGCGSSGRKSPCRGFVGIFCSTVGLIGFFLYDFENKKPPIRPPLAGCRQHARPTANQPSITQSLRSLALIDCTKAACIMITARYTNNISVSGCAWRASSSVTPVPLPNIASQDRSQVRIEICLLQA